MAKHKRTKLQSCIVKVIKEGKKRNQAAAICFSKQRRGKL